MMTSRPRRRSAIPTGSCLEILASDRAIVCNWKVYSEMDEAKEVRPHPCSRQVVGVRILNRVQTLGECVDGRAAISHSPGRRELPAGEACG